MNIKKVFLILPAFFFLISCGNDLKDRSSKELLSAYLNKNDKAIIFGNVDIKTILDKADYKSIPKVSVLINEEIKQFENALDLSQGISTAIEVSDSKNINKPKVIGFAKVKNLDSLNNKVSALGYNLKEVSGIKYLQENELTLGVKEGIAIFITKSGKYDGKKEVLEAFKKCEQDLSAGKIEDILNQKADILFGVNMENIYKNSTESMSMLSKTKQKELIALMSDSYADVTINFLNGKAEFVSRNLFSDQLSKRLYFDEDANATILKKLGTGNARFGLSFNLNSEKLQNFMTDFVPDFNSQLANINFQLQMAMSAFGKKPFSGIWNGKLGLVMVGDAISDGSFVPEFNFHLGLGDKGKEVNDLIGSFVSDMPKNSQGYYSIEGMSIKINDKEITAYSEKNAIQSKSLNIPDFAKDFGKKSFSGFLNLDGLNLKDLDLGDEMQGLMAIKNIYFEGDKNGSRLIISAKKSDSNILKQIADMYLLDLKSKINLLN